MTIAICHACGRLVDGRSHRCARMEELALIERMRPVVAEIVPEPVQEPERVVGPRNIHWTVKQRLARKRERWIQRRRERRLAKQASE